MLAQRRVAAKCLRVDSLLPPITPHQLRLQNGIGSLVPTPLTACQGRPVVKDGGRFPSWRRSKGGRSGHARSNHRTSVSDDDHKAHRAPSRHRKRVSTSEKPQGASHVYELHRAFQLLGLLVFVPSSDCSRSFASLWLFRHTPVLLPARAQWLCASVNNIGRRATVMDRRSLSGREWLSCRA